MQLNVFCQIIVFILVTNNSGTINSADSNHKSVEPVKISDQLPNLTSHDNKVGTKLLTSKVNYRDNGAIIKLRTNSTIPYTTNSTNNSTKRVIKLETVSISPEKGSRIARKINLLPNYAPSIIAPKSPSEVITFTFSKPENGRLEKYVSVTAPNLNSSYKRTASHVSCMKQKKTDTTKIKVDNHVNERLKHYPTLITKLVIETTPRTITRKDLSVGLKRQTHNVSTLKPDQKNTSKSNDKTTTVSDKVKFFEMYDTNTLKTLVTKIILSTDYISDIHNDTKDEKNNYSEKRITKKEVPNKPQKGNNLNWRKQAIFRSSFENITKLNLNVSNEKENLRVDKMYSRIADWYKYSFIGAYINEPANIQCDAAAISPHWLIAAGSCLSTNKITPSGGRSAFVAYCGADLKNPGRLNYVKHITIHPKYHSLDNERMLLYNIGLIRVLTPMSTCPGWAPIRFTSYHFFTREEGSRAIAVGWGLDRYTSNIYLDQQKLPLKEYGSLIYSDRCPGSVFYRQLENSDAKKYLYCLTLPPYRGEKNDPVHGGLLLYEGNVIGLYLKEERRPEGIQTAQYTGIWRALPWITEVAQETEELDKLLIDML